MTGSTLGWRLGGSEFITGLRSHIQAKADNAPQVLGDGAWVRQHVAALRDFDNFLAGLAPDDPRLIILDCVAEERTPRPRFAHEFRFEPTEHQQLLLARLGNSGPPPPPSMTLEELAASAVKDFAEERRAALYAAQAASRAAEERTTALEAELERRVGLDAELDEAQSKIVTLEGELEEQERQQEELRGYLSADGRAHSPSNDELKPRRTKVDGETGVYYRDTPDGRVYEIGFPDDKGKQRWKTVGPRLADAVELRKELAGKPYEPQEKVEAVA